MTDYFHYYSFSPSPLFFSILYTVVHWVTLIFNTIFLPSCEPLTNAHLLFYSHYI